ncbi:unnamed protein product [Cuscuta europaea]|uniref:RIN4 pathogenic type III effector avirulence factor Avr cleavage site domain-containing protein n=1 Tax=Cuscuta europaea TaxID=41803 RepID=A0A9P1E2W1_CUSEU|nr:unnamed protein product [Cuscuta europaea]
MDASDYGYWTRKSHVPAFGSWDCNDDFPIPFTQCFESATQAGLLRYSYAEDRDLYVARDLYDNRIGTPAMIVVPRRKGKGGSYRKGEKGLEEGNDAWVVCGCDCESGLKQCSAAASPPLPRRAPKAVDEDLYKISPDLLYAKPKHERRVWGFLASCLQPSCVC